MKASVMLVLSLSLLLVAPSLSTSLWSWSSEEETRETPDFCGRYDCPHFTVIETNDDYELRSYDETYWVGVEMVTESGSDMWEDRSHMGEEFMKLFAYIQGANEQSMKMPMTVPVLMTHQSNKVMMMFMIPHDIASSAPQPTNPDVTLITTPARQVYVKSFGGFAYGFFNNQNYYKSHLTELKNDLTRDGITVDESMFMTAGYNSPWTIFGRHNEVAVEKN